MLSTAGATHYLQYYTYSCIRCFASSTFLRNQKFRKHDSKFEEPVTMLSIEDAIYIRGSDVKNIVTMLSTVGAIHFVYQTLRVFNMLTKSKISEARFQVRRTCNHVEHLRCDIYSWFRTDRFVTMLSNEVAIHTYFKPL